MSDAKVFTTLAKPRAVIGSNLGSLQLYRNDGVLCRIKAAILVFRQLVESLKLSGEGDEVSNIIRTNMCLVVPITAVGQGALYFRELNLFRLHNSYNKSYL